MPARIALVHYSASGHVFQLARALRDGAQDAGAEVRFRRVAELAPEEAIRTNDRWWQHHRMVCAEVEEASHDDLDWANAYALGTPTRYGLPAAQLKQFLDTCAPLWKAGRLKDGVATSFTSTQNEHGGQESTLLALNNAFYHWGSLILPPDTSERASLAAGGNPYGTSYGSLDDDGDVPEAFLEAARRQGARLARFAAALDGA